VPRKSVSDFARDALAEHRLIGLQKIQFGSAERARQTKQIVLFFLNKSKE
jgi:hypothetical protein